MSYKGEYSQEAVREYLRVKQEVFMPLVHRVGEAQVDFGYALVKVSIVSFCFGTGIIGKNLERLGLKSIWILGI